MLYYKEDQVSGVTEVTGGAHRGRRHVLYVQMTSVKHVQNHNGLQRDVPDMDEFLPRVLKYTEKLASPAHTKVPSGAGLHACDPTLRRSLAPAIDQHVRAYSSKSGFRARFLTVFIKVVHIGSSRLPREKGDDPKIDRECSPISNFI